MEENINEQVNKGGNNKTKYLGIVVLLVIVALLIFSGKGDGSNDELAFNVNLNALSYVLPDYTHMCIPDSKQFCTAEGCEEMSAQVFVLVDEVNQTYSRCDNQPCDTYDSTFGSSGIYTVINPLPPNHGEVKLSQDGSYTETVSLGDDYYISRGKCTRK